MVRWNRYQQRCLAVIGVLAVAGSVSASGPFDWAVGEWKGIRRDADGEAPMRLQVLLLPDGSGLFERLEVTIEPSPYVGVSVLTRDPKTGNWVKFYTNPVRSTIARLEGSLDDGVLVLRSVTPGRAREGRLTARRIGEDRWRRTQEVSEDGGKTWRVLFTDELHRANP